MTALTKQVARMIDAITPEIDWLISGVIEDEEFAAGEPEFPNGCYPECYFRSLYVLWGMRRLIAEGAIVEADSGVLFEGKYWTVEDSE